MLEALGRRLLDVTRSSELQDWHVYAGSYINKAKPLSMLFFSRMAH
jgi:hypothetical protein